AVIDVTDRPDIDVRLAAIEFFLCHTLRTISLFRDLALNSAHDLFRERGRHLFVLPEVHGETAPALRARTQVGGVTEHLRQWHAGLDDLGSAAQFHSFDASPSRV